MRSMVEGAYVAFEGRPLRRAEPVLGPTSGRTRGRATSPALRVRSGMFT